MSSIDKYAYSSKLCKIKTENKLWLSGSLLIICLIFSSELVSAMTIVIMSAVTLFLGGCRLKHYIKLLTIPLTFLVTGILTVLVTQLAADDSAIVAVHLGRHAYGLTPASLKTGINIMLKSFGAITCLYFFSLNTPMNAFLSYLRKRFPGTVVELMELIYRFIFIIWEEARKIRVAQASRLGYRGFGNSMSSTGELITGVFIRALRCVERMNAALESRGFEEDFSYLIEEETSSRLLVVCTVTAGAALVAVGILERVYL